MSYRRPKYDLKPPTEEVGKDFFKIVIISEDTYAAKDYFEKVLNPMLEARNGNEQVRKYYQFKVLPTKDGHSSAKSLQARLEELFRNPGIITEVKKFDEIWVLPDRDDWPKEHISNLRETCEELNIYENKVKMALSAPCFDLWIFLHFKQIGGRIITCDEIATQLKSPESKPAVYIGKSINTTTPNLFTENNIQTAIKRAKELKEPCFTDVYKIVEPLFSII